MVTKLINILNLKPSFRRLLINYQVLSWEQIKNFFPQFQMP